jgi:hypothetical protein
VKLSGGSRVDPHPYRMAAITKLSVSVLDRAMRDAQLVEVGHRVVVCPVKNWPDQDRRHLLMSRQWLTNDQDEVLRLWTSGAGLEVVQVVKSVRRRVEWTEALERAAPPDTRPPYRFQRWPSAHWPFRRCEDSQGR